MFSKYYEKNNKLEMTNSFYQSVERLPLERKLTQSNPFQSTNLISLDKINTAKRSNCPLGYLKPPNYPANPNFLLTTNTLSPIHHTSPVCRRCRRHRYPSQSRCSWHGGRWLMPIGFFRSTKHAGFICTKQMVFGKLTKG